MKTGTIFEKLTGPLSVGTLIRAHRVAHSLSRSELEQKLKFTSGSLAQLEDGAKRLSLEETVKLARELGECPEFYSSIWMNEQDQAD